MKKIIALTNFSINGKYYKKDDEVNCNEKEQKKLLSLGYIKIRTENKKKRNKEEE